MKNPKILVLLTALLFATTNSFGEIYRGIQPLSTLAELKAQFPGATFVLVEAAWTLEDESLYEVTGLGLSGKMMIKMYDTSVSFRKFVEENPEEADDVLRSLAVSRDETNTVEWVRYVPNSQVPVERLIAKYGPAESSGFSEDDFTPYQSWDSRGVLATLSEDSKYAVLIDYTYTKSEMCAAYMQRNVRLTKACENLTGTLNKSKKKVKGGR